MDVIINSLIRPDSIEPEDVLLLGADRALMEAHALTELDADLAWLEGLVEIGSVPSADLERAKGLVEARHRATWGSWLAELAV